MEVKSKTPKAPPDRSRVQLEVLQGPLFPHATESIATGEEQGKSTLQDVDWLERPKQTM